MAFVLLLLVAVIGGAANALAGGGTLLVFPALLLAGVPPVTSDATSSLILMPGGIASAWVYRTSFAELPRREIIQLTVISTIGSTVGSMLLVSTPDATFSNVMPWLLLIAALAFTLASRPRPAAANRSAGKSTALLFAGQFIISVYGGYFGAGMGVLMMALFLMASGMDMQTANGMRLICGTEINVLAVILFAWRGELDYRAGIPMSIAGIAGGVLGARIVSRLKDSTARNGVLIYAWALTAWFFLKQLYGYGK
jgi:uncharacterized membrane protein YfcA